MDKSLLAGDTALVTGAGGARVFGAELAEAGLALHNWIDP